jgi:hypothetical protein
VEAVFAIHTDGPFKTTREYLQVNEGDNTNQMRSEHTFTIMTMNLAIISRHIYVTETEVGGIHARSTDGNDEK